MRAIRDFAVSMVIIGGICSCVSHDEGRQKGEIAAPRFTWQAENATVLPTGDLEWDPRPFTFNAGASARYIDFDGGDDSKDGSSKETAWKRHPWDPKAEGNAKTCSGVHSYVFKGGVYYRGEMAVRDAGEPGNPIKLIRDPSWGKGEAVICGSEIVKGWTKGADNKDIPEPEKVWYADLDYAPRSVWMVRAEGDFLRIPLARMPNWKVSDPENVRSEWWSFSEPVEWDKSITEVDGKKMHLCGDSRNIKDKPKELFENALIWYERAGVASMPHATPVRHVDAAQGKLGFCGWHDVDKASGIIMKGCRYYLEDKPQYLDDPDGEFWFDKKGTGGRLYLRLPGDADPNAVRIEAARRGSLIHGEKVEHLDVSGLTFRFTSTNWDITEHYYDFSVKPFVHRRSVHPACVEIWGSGRDVRIANCLFEHVYFPVHAKAQAKDTLIDDVTVEDNDIRHTDYSGIVLVDGGVHSHVQPRGRLGDVRVLRNRLFDIGGRPLRFSGGLGSINVAGAETVEIAGNIIERAWNQGVNVTGGKPHLACGDVPFSRVLIHHNKVWNSLLGTSDYGGIETWQGGPAYVFNNLSRNAQGMWLWQLMQQEQRKSSGFGHAYYLDGAFKNYYFNNIAWGKTNDQTSPLVNCSAFQEIIGYQNTFFNNTAYNYVVGSRRQDPAAGRNKYLGNVWSGMSEQVLRHGEPARITGKEGNAADVGKGSAHYALETDAYAGNVFHDFKKLGAFEPDEGCVGWNIPEDRLLSLDGGKAALEKSTCMVSTLGVVSLEQPLRDPANGDFRPANGSITSGGGAKVFVPWTLSGVAAEWNFYHTGDDPTNLIDEHWRMTDYFRDRADYRKCPLYPLKAMNVDAGDYVNGPLEDWISGALRLEAARKQYATLSNAEMMKPFSYEGLTVSLHEGGGKKSFTAEGEALKNPQIYKGNLLIEAYFQTVAGHTAGVLVEKMKDSGYSLSVDAEGRMEFVVKGGGAASALASKSAINDGAWHHVVAEADRQAKTLAIYVDGKLEGKGAGLDGAVSLANDGDLFVGGTAAGRHFDGTLDFMRLAHGTLADARTTIEELYAWEFDGPFLRDFTGKKAEGGRRDAGALQGRP